MTPFVFDLRFKSRYIFKESKLKIGGLIQIKVKLTFRTPYFIGSLAD